jgi:phospholipid transport system substrate-binding protein
MVSVKQEIQAEGAVYPMEYSMALSKKTGQWKAINVVINGINMRNIFRSQFANAVQKAGGDIDAVIADWSAE